MDKLKISILLLIIFFSFSCSKKQIETEKKINTKSQDLEMITNYNEAYELLKKNDTYNAAQKFLNAELLFPQSVWAPRAALMASYSYYLQNYYSEALDNLKRYTITYPNDKNLAYGYYLIAICYYEMIEDEKRDIEPILEAKENFEYIIENYPGSDFALDAKFKLDYIKDMLASKEMYVGRHYQKKNKWIAAINRFKVVIEEYDQTIYVEEALHRLVEINYKIGLIEESKLYANLLGYNYQSGEWYKKSYKIFNKNYNEKKNDKKIIKKDGVIKKFKKLFD
tara:strand:+ start:1882 stop:2724 length:843 start_codon:yes stop_codon:yes gene_type:complete